MASCHLYSVSSTLRCMEEVKLHVMETLHNWGLVFEPHRHKEYVMYFGSIGSIMSRLGVPQGSSPQGQRMVCRREGKCRDQYRILLLCKRQDGTGRQPMTNRDFPVSHWAVSVTYREMVTIMLNSTVANKRHTPWKTANMCLVRKENLTKNRENAHNSWINMKKNTKAM